MTRPLPVWTVLTAGIPLTLLLDLAAAETLDSAAILAQEQATALAVAAWKAVSAAGAARDADSGAA